MEAPDSWEKQAVEEVTEQLTNSSIDSQNAASLSAGKNVFAKEFVPNFGSFTEPPQTIENQPQTSILPKAAEEPAETSAEIIDKSLTQQNGGIDKEEIAETSEKMEEEPSGNWSDKASEDEEEDSSTMDEGGDDNDSERGGATAIKISKKKSKVVSNVARKDHLNIIFIGHVDAGKSTIGGHIMYLTGMVDKRTLFKYQQEAKEKNRESWYLSWALDTNQEERDKGKTVEVGRAYFETENKHFTILDAPGHKSFVPNMIGGASQADLAVLVISARKGEFETGFERGGQTREHAMLVKTAGVRHVIILVNKMDDPTVNWDEARFKEIKDKLTPYLKKCGFNPKTDLSYLPCSGLTGANLKETNPQLCPWYTGPPLIGFLDSMLPISRVSTGPLRLPIVDRYKDMGTIVSGKIESGSVAKGAVYTIMPNRCSVEVMQMWSDEDETEEAFAGENVKLKLKNIEDEDVSPGFILCSPDNLCHTAKIFDAQVVILEHKSIICAGYSPVLHIHCCAEQVTIKALICLIDKKTNAKSTVRPRFVKQDQVAIIRLEVVAGMICMEPFKEFPQMGRFTLRDEGKTIAMGKVLKVVA